MFSKKIVAPLLVFLLGASALAGVAAFSLGIVCDTSSDLASFAPHNSQTIVIKSGANAGVWTYSSSSSATVGADVLNGPGGTGRYLRLSGSTSNADIPSVATVSDLFALTAIDGRLYRTLGYSTAGTGANAYRYSSSSTATIDGGFVLPGVGGTLSFSGTTFNGTAGTGRFIAVDQSVADVAKFGALGDGVTDDGPALRRALLAAKPVDWSSGTYLVGDDPASIFIDGGSVTRYGYCLSVPSGSVWKMHRNATIKRAAGAKSWNRVVSINGKTNVEIQGTLRIDANVAGVDVDNNEHMHGLFIFDSSNVRIDAVESLNARGDNVFIGGTDQDTVSSHVHIGTLYAKTAGRKNLVFQHFDNIRIDSAYLDNSAGGATVYSGTADSTDKHSLDVEPDSFDGSKYHRASIGNLTTYSSGSDFTAGTTAAQADKCIIDIGTLNHTHVNATYSGSTPVPAWTHYGCTVRIGQATWSGVGESASFEIIYQARLLVGKATVECASGSFGDMPMLIASSSDLQPEVSFDELNFTNTTGGGVEVRDAIFRVGTFKARTAGTSLWCRAFTATSQTFMDVHVGDLDLLDCGGQVSPGYAVLFQTDGSSNATLATFGRVKHQDTRGTKLNEIFYIDTGAASNVTIGEINNAETTTNVVWGGSDKFYRVTGGGGYPGQYVCYGTPESMVTAPVGSVAHRIDGGTGTANYVKESGTGNTGWVAK